MIIKTLKYVLKKHTNILHKYFKISSICKNEINNKLYKSILCKKIKTLEYLIHDQFNGIIAVNITFYDNFTH